MKESDCAVIRRHFLWGFMLSFLALSFPGSRGSTPQFLWLGMGLGDGADVSRCIAVDASGNSYISGWFNSTNFFFGDTVLTNISRSVFPPWDSFVAKYNADGSPAWARSLAGTADDRALGIAVDAQHNCYVAGSFLSSNLFFGEVVLTNRCPNGNSSFFLAKLDPDGNLLWIRGPDTGYYQTSAGVAVTSQGDCYLVGTFVDTNVIGGTKLVSRGSTDVMLLKYDTNGNLLWAQQGGGTGVDRAAGIAAANADTAYLLANVSSTDASFGSRVVRNLGGNNGNSDVVVAKYDPAGTALWARNYGGIDMDSGAGIAVDQSGDCYITGNSSSTNPTFGKVILPNSPRFNHDDFIAKLDPTGEGVWAKGTSGDFLHYCEAIAVDFAGACYVAGYFEDLALTIDTAMLVNSEADNPFRGADAFLAKFDTAGNLLWVVQPMGTNDQRSLAVAVDKYANAYLTGWTQGTNVLFGSFVTTNAYLDLFVAKIESDFPILQIAASGTDVVVSWPAAQTGFVLERAVDLQTWMPVPDQVIVINNRNTVTLPILESPSFFRLRSN